MIKMTKKTFKTITFGCKVNFYETEAVREALERMVIYTRKKIQPYMF